MTSHDDDQNETPIDQDRWTPLSPTARVLLPLQLVISIYMLLLLPSGLALGKLCGARIMGTLPYEYLSFFSLLLLPRSYRYGKFAKPISNNNKKRGTSIVEVLLFITTLIGSHWRAAYHYSKSSQTRSMLFPKTLTVVRLGAIALVAWSGWTLGKSYDRVTCPDTLTTQGPYAVVRHPIYTSYLLLFGSTLVTLRSYGACFALMGIAFLFYKHRMDSEDELLAETFGQEYERYKQQVPWRLIPFIV